MFDLTELLNLTATSLEDLRVTLDNQKCFVYEQGEEIELLTTVTDIRYDNGLYHGSVHHGDADYVSTVQWNGNYWI